MRLVLQLTLFIVFLVIGMSSQEGGQIYSAGHNREGQLGRDGNGPSVEEVSFPDTTDIFVQVCAGTLHSLVLSASGDAYSFGHNSRGQCGGRYPIVYRPQKIASNISSIACGAYHSLLLQDNGIVLSLGDSIGYNLWPMPVSSQLFTAIAAGDSHSLLLQADGSVYCFGNNENEQCGLEEVSQVSTPQEVLLLRNKSSEFIACGANHSVVLSESGMAFGMGNGEAAGKGSTVIKEFSNERFSSIAAGGLFTFLWKSKEHIEYFGPNDSFPLEFLDQLKVEKMIVGANSVFFKTVEGLLYSVGDNTFGQLGRTGSQSIGVVENIANRQVISVAAGDHHSLFILGESIPSSSESIESIDNVQSDSEGLTLAIIAGIAVASFVFFIAVMFVGFTLFYTKRKKIYELSDPEPIVTSYSPTATEVTTSSRPTRSPSDTFGSSVSMASDDSDQEQIPRSRASSQFSSASRSGTFQEPLEDFEAISWQANISRLEAEDLLRNSPMGTFLTRWSSNTNSYVLSYVKPDRSFKHVGYIYPKGEGLSAVIARTTREHEDEYPSILEYVEQERKAGTVTLPFSTNPIYHTVTDNFCE